MLVPTYAMHMHRMHTLWFIIKCTLLLLVVCRDSAGFCKVYANSCTPIYFLVIVLHMKIKIIFRLTFLI